MLEDEGGCGMFIGCRASAYFELPEGTLPDKHREQLLASACRYMESATVNGRFIIED